MLLSRGKYEVVYPAVKVELMFYESLSCLTLVSNLKDGEEERGRELPALQPITSSLSFF